MGHDDQVDDGLPDWIGEVRPDDGVEGGITTDGEPSELSAHELSLAMGLSSFWDDDEDRVDDDDRDVINDDMLAAIIGGGGEEDGDSSSGRDKGDVSHKKVETILPPTGTLDDPGYDFDFGSGSSSSRTSKSDKKKKRKQKKQKSNAERPTPRTDSSTKSKDGGSPLKTVVTGVFVLALLAGIVLGISHLVGGGNGAGTEEQADSPTTSTSSSTSSEDNDSGIDDKFPTSTKAASGPGSHRTPIDAIKGYINAMWIERDVNGVFAYLNPGTLYTKEATQKTIDDLAKRYPNAKIVMDIQQNEPNSFTWLVAARVTTNGKSFPFSQNVVVIKENGKWYVNRIKNIT